MILKTFEEYAVLEVVSKILEYSCAYTRTYILFEIYTDRSSKHDQSDALVLDTEWLVKGQLYKIGTASWGQRQQDWAT
jgi:hypothetical protein